MALEHAEVGNAINKSGIKREDIFLTTKAQTSGYRETKKGIDESLIRAQQDYFDLMIIHWPMSDSLGTYQALEEAYQAGKLRSIGLSNFNHDQVNEIMNNFDTKPVVDQIETSVFKQQKKMHKYLIENNIVHESWSPLGEGMKALFNDPTLLSLAEKYNKTVPQIALHLLVQENIMTIPGSTNPLHMKDNLDIFDFEFTAEEMETLRGLDQKRGIGGWPASMDQELDY